MIKKKKIHTVKGSENTRKNLDMEKGKTTPQRLKRRSGNMTSKFSEMWSVQCGECTKWRLISTQEEYEEIRGKFIEDPFVCTKKLGASCEDPADIEYDNSHTWVIDKPNLPKTPPGFKRRMVMRKDWSRMDCYYSTSNEKNLRSMIDVHKFLESYPEYQKRGISVNDFSFLSPKVMEDTLPDNKYED
ncbi:Methyl-CpG-binding domain protein 4 [Orobanche hederae]